MIATLELEPHPEGGFYREVFRSSSIVQPQDERDSRSALTTIYFLLTSDAVSRWHQVSSDEIWHLYEGGPIELLDLDLDAGRVHRRRLASIGEGQPVAVIPAGHWQAAQALGPYALMGCTVGPGFDFADFRLMADDAPVAHEVRTTWPELNAWI